MPRRHPSRSALTAALLTAATLSVAACARAEPNPSTATVPSPEPATATPAPPGGAPEAPGERMVVSEATLRVRTDRPEVAADAAARLVADRGGYVASKDAARAGDVVVSVSMVLRVPARTLEDVLAALRGAGSVLAEGQTGRDVTEEFADTEAELRAKRRLEERLLGLVGQTAAVKDMLEVEHELSRVRTDIERLEGHARLLSNQAAFATVQYSAEAAERPSMLAAESVGSRWSRAVSRATDAFVDVTAGLIVAAGVALPLGVPVALVALLARRRRRRVDVAAVLPAPV